MELLEKKMTITKDPKIRLEECSSLSNCSLINLEFSNPNEGYKNIVEICKELPRSKILEERTNYFHCVCRSLIFRFPDDLEILKLPNEAVIQMKSFSRVGVSDLGVNKNRINNLYKKLIKRFYNGKEKNVKIKM